MCVEQMRKGQLQERLLLPYASLLRRPALDQTGHQGARLRLWIRWNLHGPQHAHVLRREGAQEERCGSFDDGRGGDVSGRARRDLCIITPRVMHLHILARRFVVVAAVTLRYVLVFDSMVWLYMLLPWYGVSWARCFRYPSLCR